MSDTPQAQTLLEYWYQTLEPADWFVVNTSVDSEISARFAPWLALAEAGELDHWQADPVNHEALVLLLDQVPRNSFRGSARSFALDPLALKIARQFIEQHRPAFTAQPPIHRRFMLLPFEHAEDLAAQDEGIGWFRHFGDDPEGLDFALRHREPISMFGRFPHRNPVLGRETTPAEAAWLKEHPGGF